MSLPSSEINPCLFVADPRWVEGSQALGDIEFITIILLVAPKGKERGNVVHPATCLGSSSDPGSVANIPLKIASLKHNVTARP